MLTVTTKTGKIQKQVFIVRRIEVTKGEYAGRIVHFVCSVQRKKGQMVEHNYQVITFNDQDGRISCDCESRGDCCHKIEAACYDMRRCNTVAPLKARLVATHAAPVVTPEVIEQTAEVVNITTEQVAEIVPFAQAYREHKADVAAQRQAEQDTAKIAPNYQMSSIEANLPAWLKATMAGKSRNGQFSGRVA